ncbi:hypothetical protein EJ05DRAFT_386308 [Pseudovirgaria hyperparasitica]|uniref:Uncharacterized protein n=1 Tax=Pseudovirgaria hyperparasitica TaxID=470096 RepID=A0A6A6W379_9PEZI|nr:uncharacterized protein EJ05DRAFT_386308 [Pseudovirgaria hyperparasitica]KAF2757312.1 hypothetical protein EJ05DRAFT_386308 [Pseudovirgaria hyperparasitica]
MRISSLFVVALACAAEAAPYAALDAAAIQPLDNAPNSLPEAEAPAITTGLEKGLEVSSMAAVIPALELDEKNTTALAKRSLISSPYQKRTIQLALKQALHGIAAGTTWVWDISYHYITDDGGATGHLNGNLVQGDGSFSFGPFKIDHSWVNKVDGIVTATFDAVIGRTNQKMSLTLTWAEEFASNAARLENHGTSSFATYYSAGGRQEHLPQSFFSYSLKAV